MAYISNRRSFLRHASAVLAATQAGPLLRFASAAESGSVVAETSSGKVRGTVVGDIKIFKGIPYGAPTSGKNRFLPPRKPEPWTGTRDALAYGPTAPQVSALSRPSAGRRLPGAECVHAGDERRREAARDGVAARRRIRHRFRFDAHSGRHQSRAHRRRGGGHHQSPSQCVRLHLSGRAGGLGLRSLGRRGNAGHHRRARMGARQYCALRRRSESGHDLRPVGRRPQGGDADGDARRARGCIIAPLSRAARCCV